MGDEEIRQKYLELQMLSEQIKQMESHLQAVSSKSQELDESINSFGSLKGKSGSRLLCPVSDGIFLKAELKSDSEVIVNVGAGVCVATSIDKAGRMLQEKRDELSRYAGELGSEVEKASSAAKSLESEITRLAGGQQKV